MMLSTREESLINVIWALPPNEAEKVLNRTHQLADLARGRKIEWSASGSYEDLAEATAASSHHFEEQQRQETLKPGDVAVGAFLGAEVTKTRPAVVLSSEAYHRCMPDVVVA